MKTGSIDKFITSFKKDLARPSRFEVKITPPPGLGADSRWTEMTLRCETAELPGKTFMTHDQKIYGPTEKYPYQHAYNDINLTFIVTDDMVEKKMFEQWINLIAPMKSYNFNYSNVYRSTITINQYDVSNKISYGVRLIDAYPTGMNQLDLDWSSDGHHKLVMTFAYTYWQKI